MAVHASFGDTFQNVLILGAGSGTDVAAALRHGVEHVDAVEIDPVIIRLGRELSSRSARTRDPRVTVINDDARHFLRTTTEEVRPRRVRADRFADAAVELLGRAARELHVHGGVVPRGARSPEAATACWSIYNYFRERWLVDRLANTAAAAFGEEPRVHVHEARAYLGVLMAGPRLAHADGAARRPRSGHGVRAVARAEPGARCTSAIRRSSRRPTTGRSSTCAIATCPRHYAVGARDDPGRSRPSRCFATLRALARGRGGRGAWSWQFFLLGAGFMLLETKSIIQFALLWGSTWVVASLAIASVLTMALVANFVVARREITPPVARRRRCSWRCSR